MTSPIPQHSSKHVNHYTPEPVVTASRAVLGGIDLDPASCAFANELVQATEFFDKRGLERKWSGRVFLNCPGGDAGAGHTSRSSQVVWWRKLVDEYASDRVRSAIFVGFSLELLQAAQGTGAQPLDFPVCIPKKRLRFDVAADDLIRGLLSQLAEEGDPRSRARLEKKLNKLEPLRGQRVSGDQPTHGNVIVGMPDFAELEEWVGRFREKFEPVGGVWTMSHAFFAE